MGTSNRIPSSKRTILSAATPPDKRNLRRSAALAAGDFSDSRSWKSTRNEGVGEFMVQAGLIRTSNLINAIDAKTGGGNVLARSWFSPTHHLNPTSPA